MTNPNPPEIPPFLLPKERIELTPPSKIGIHSRFLVPLLNPATGELYDEAHRVEILLNLLRKTPEHRSEKRIAMLEALGNMQIAPEQSQAVADVLGKMLLGTDTSKTRRTGVRLRHITSRTIAMTLFMSVVLGFITFGDVLKGSSSLLGAWLASLVITLFATGLVMPWVSLILDARDTEAMRLQAANTLLKLQLPESVGVLAKAARGKLATAKIAVQALSRLLPALTPEHYGQVGADATPELCALLRYLSFPLVKENHFIGLWQKVLAALEKVGDGRAVGPVERFIKAAPPWELREKAEAILPILLERQERENASSTLLRGSSAPQADSSQMLRAASYAETTAPEVLLRPSIGGQGDAEQ